MLRTVGAESLDALIEAAVPASIRPTDELRFDAIGDGLSEGRVLDELRGLASRNRVFRSYLGMGYSDCVTPPVLQRNILEDPRWYTPYTPYQSEVSQGRLEALLNFQTMVIDLTGMEIANASLLDEGTAAAEAMAMCHQIRHDRGSTFLVSSDCHPATIAVVQTRASRIGIRVVVGDHREFGFHDEVFAALVQYPASDGAIHDFRPMVERAHQGGSLVVVAADILSLALLTPPGEWNADVVVGTTQRFGVPMGYGGPHAAFLATRDAHKRLLPGRIVGVSRDRDGNPGLRLAIQTREQHIRRERATSNICTAQVLLAVVASMYAVYHGPDGIRRIAQRVHDTAAALESGLRDMGCETGTRPYFDTVRVRVGDGRADAVATRARERHMNLRILDPDTICVAVDETTTLADVDDLLAVFSGVDAPPAAGRLFRAGNGYDAWLERTSSYLTHPVFSRYHSETEMMRYLNRLANRDLSLASSMIPLGSCTMKLNAAAELMPITWPEFARIHPYVPQDQAGGYSALISKLETMLAEITGFDAVSMQPNAGSQGEYAGLLVIMKYHHDNGQAHRNVCLIPQSAHGTNPASAAMAGMKIVVVKCDSCGNIDLADLRVQAEANAGSLAALMVTYPSTHGVFEEPIREICDIVHRFGGQVYLDGANMNAQVGIARPGDYGADVCHLNLHKTFCIPHGGGGPGMGPIGVRAHLAPYLPTHPLVRTGGERGIGAISSAPYGSPSILPIPYAYIRLMGTEGLRRATEVAILNANYVARRLDPHFPVLYKGATGLVAHECIIDLRPIKATSGIEVEDVAKRLADYGFHASTVSFPVPGTMMIEPTESESREELDRFCDAMIAIREEIAAIEQGRADRVDNVIKNAPHTAAHVTADHWEHAYTREQAAYPAPWTREAKYWPPVARVDNVYGDRNLICSCGSVADYDG